MKTVKIIKPYYKYKQEAYNNLNRLVKSLLEEFGFYEEFPQFKDTDIVAYSYFNHKGDVSFRLADSNLWLFTLEPSFHIKKNSFLAGRDNLTLKESQIISKNIRTIFKAGPNSTVVKELNDVIAYWHVSKTSCFFKSVNDLVYINYE